MPKWELTGLRPEKIEVELDGVKFAAREIKAIFIQYRDWKLEQGSRMVPGDDDRIWEALKAVYPRYILKSKKLGKPGVSVGAAWSFIRYIERRMKNKGLVELAEAQRRADICSACPQRSAVVGCGVCVNALKLFIKPPFALAPVPPKACGACGCVLNLKVWVPREVLGSADEFDYAPECWMR